METDRGAVLTVRAAARGVIDFKAAAPLDVTWWRRVNVLLRSMARDDDIRVLDAGFRHQCALIANGSLTADSFKSSQEATKELLIGLMNAYQPWAKTDDAGRGIENLVNAYKTVFGDPDDPVFRDKLAKDLAYLEAKERGELAPTVRPETDEERIERLMQARDAARKSTPR